MNKNNKMIALYIIGSIQSVLSGIMGLILFCMVILEVLTESFTLFILFMIAFLSFFILCSIISIMDGAKKFAAAKAYSKYRSTEVLSNISAKNIGLMLYYGLLEDNGSHSYVSNSRSAELSNKRNHLSEFGYMRKCPACGEKSRGRNGRCEYCGTPFNK